MTLITAILFLPVKVQPRSPTRRVWLRVYSSSRLAEAQQVRALLAPTGSRGGRLRQVFLRQSRTRGGATVYEVLTGPYRSPMDAVLRGLALRRDPRFTRAGIRLQALAVLLPTSFLPLPLHIDGRSLDRLNPGRKRSYPVLGDLLVSRALGFSLPQPTLPAVEHATARFAPWRPLLVLGDHTACATKGQDCLRWFEVLHPVLIRTAWLPAYLVALHRDLRRYEIAEGSGKIRIRGALWRIGRASGGILYGLMFRRGTLPPQRHTVILDDRHRPPFRLVVDKHGPGIYNAEGKVVTRIKLRPWQFKRPPLWQVPERLQRPRPDTPSMRAGTMSAGGMRAAMSGPMRAVMSGPMRPPTRPPMRAPMGATMR